MMVLAMEIVISLLGLWMLFTGKGWGKEAVKHWQYRLLGAVLVTLVPVIAGVVITIGIVYAFNHPGLDDDQIVKELKWPIMGVEFGFCIIYGITAAVWEPKIRKKVAAEQALAGTDLA